LASAARREGEGIEHRLGGGGGGDSVAAAIQSHAYANAAIATPTYYYNNQY